MHQCISHIEFGTEIFKEVKMKSTIFEDFNLQKLFWLIFIGLIALTFLWTVVRNLFSIDKSINLGLGWMLIIIGMIIMGAFILMQKVQGKDPQMSRINSAIMLIAIGILIFLLLNIKQLVPSIFTAAVYDLQSIFGMI